MFSQVTLPGPGRQLASLQRPTKSLAVKLTTIKDSEKGFVFVIARLTLGLSPAALGSKGH